jgi:4-amino-4-deoxy-L-arabinose transferase-like glycosyltransferase
MRTLAGVRRERLAALAIAAVTLLALALRVVHLGRVPEDQFYDAAVRSMSLSWHNFLYGALEPGASAAIDKPPLDLWLQVIAVKLLGWGPTALKLPEALGGTLAVPLLYDTVRRVAGRLAGLLSAFVLAILPLSVVASRSDTMDSVMSAMLVATAWLLVVAVQRRRARWVVLAGAMLGLAFNVKLFEALVPLPAFVLFYLLATRGEPARGRLARAAAAGTVFVVVSLAWLTFVSLTPAADRPWPVGSTDGSVWNAVFVYNGIDRIGATVLAGHATTVALGAVIPAVLSPPGPLRLFAHNEIDYGGLIGTALFAALVLAAAALAGRRSLRLPRTQLERAALAALALWLLTGFVLFSFSSRTHPRYLEAFTPAVAATLAVSFTVLLRRAGRSRRWSLALPALLLGCVIESAAGTGDISRAGLYGGVLLVIALAVALAVALGRTSALPVSPQSLATALLAAVLALVMANDDVRIIRHNSTVQAAEVTLSPKLVTALSKFLATHDAGAHYEAAFSAPTLAAPLIVRDARPVLLLTSLKGRPLTTLAQLRHQAASGRVRYVYTEGICPGPAYTELPACSRADEWVRAHGRDVTAELGLPTKRGLLYAIAASGRQ